MTMIKFHVTRVTDNEDFAILYDIYYHCKPLIVIQYDLNMISGDLIQVIEISMRYELICMLEFP